MSQTGRWLQVLIDDRQHGLHDHGAKIETPCQVIEFITVVSFGYTNIRRCIPPPFRYNCVSITPDFVTLARQTHPLPPKSKQLEMSSHSVSGCYEFPF